MRPDQLERRVIARGAPGATCGSYTRRVHVRHVGETVRDFYHPRVDSVTRFRYVDGEQLPWQGVLGHREARLRYDQATGTAVGIREGICGRRQLRLVRVG